MKTIICLLSLVVKKNWPISQFDVSNAFIHGDRQKEVYMKFLQVSLLLRLNMFVVSENHFMASSKPQGSGIRTCWSSQFQRLFFFFKRLLTVFKRIGDTISVIVIYVDDIIITGNNLDEILDLKQFLHSKFKVKNLRDLHYFFRDESFTKETRYYPYSKKI